MVRSIHQGDPIKFLQWTRRSPVFDCLVDCESWTLDRDTLTVIPGTPTRGALCKVVVKVTPRQLRSSPRLTARIRSFSLSGAV